MTENLRRIYYPGDLHFITFSCYRRQPFLGTSQARNIFASTLRDICDHYQFPLVGYVVMPEHVHLLIGEVPDSTHSSVMKVLKQDVAVRLEDPSRTQFWEPRFYDFNVHSAYKRREKLNYIHMNPIRRGLVRNPRFWPWSSFLNYEKNLPGLIPIDFIS